ncbi:uncharacterized protein LOC129224748 [Uloborus diversus]|uniref:uncharacterized protein LOC129224748 n=1 Tax=Uloborus diversus TaxID=327109 RepID=UPI00240999E1|nr:uncharacterized protein LOC129224748 [Uloborus diversus]
MDIIANIESSLRQLPQAEAEEIRREASRILHKAKPPRSNVSNAERKAIKSLNEDKSIVILPADKGNATTVLNTEDYRRKIRDLLDPTIYVKLRRDPTSRILKKTNSLIMKSTLPEKTKETISSSEALIPRLYGLPKIHKEELPLRPIVSAINSPTHLLSKHLASLLKPHVGATESFVRDSSHFIEKLKTYSLQSTDILVSFDVVSLFTRVPIKEAMEKVREIFSPDIADLFQHVLTTTYFQWNNDIYEQIDGVAMGSPLSPVIANFYMEKFEEVALSTAEKQPTCWLRYVDDTFVIWSHGKDELHRFLIHINSQHENIQFTMETENDGKLPFLDVLVSRRDDGSLGHRVYRKPTHTDRYLHKDSNHHPRQKRGVMKTLFVRANRICEPTAIEHEISHLTNVFQANGFSKQEIKRAFHPKIKKQPLKGDPIKFTAYLPYVEDVTDRIERLLRRHNIKTVYKPTHRTSDLLRSVKDGRDPLSAAGKAAVHTDGCTYRCWESPVIIEKDPNWGSTCVLQPSPVPQGVLKPSDEHLRLYLIFPGF